LKNASIRKKENEAKNSKLVKVKSNMLIAGSIGTLQIFLSGYRQKQAAHVQTTFENSR